MDVAGLRREVEALKEELEAEQAAMTWAPFSLNWTGHSACRATPNGGRSSRFVEKHGTPKKPAFALGSKVLERGVVKIAYTIEHLTGVVRPPPVEQGLLAGLFSKTVEAVPHFPLSADIYLGLADADDVDKKIRPPSDRRGGGWWPGGEGWAVVYSIDDGMAYTSDNLFSAYSMTPTKQISESLRDQLTVDKDGRLGTKGTSSCPCSETATVTMRVDMDSKAVEFSINNSPFVDAGIKLPTRVRPYAIIKKMGDALSIEAVRCA